MHIGEQLRQQRVKHIVSSYQLRGIDDQAFDEHLASLLEQYPSPLIELALVETLVNCWWQIPIPRGCAFLTRVHEQLANWQSQPIISTIAPDQFQQITGLDPTPIFGSSGLPPSPQTPSLGTGV
ncbi:hypothetical protein ACN4EK_21820 [Pantanalinema rosaneae CENA516]|uniref:hypothetical protein n=1 Tax=Pantanalinema rosaneae TaxID=1620701 RepID=UPI003D6EBEDB